MEITENQKKKKKATHGLNDKNMYFTKRKDDKETENNFVVHLLAVV